MEQKEVRGAPDQLPRLQGNILSESGPTPDDHPDDDAFIGYSMNALAREEVAAVEAHLAACGDCAERVQRLLAVSAEWETPEAQRRLDDLTARIVRSFDERAVAASSPSVSARFTRWLQPAGAGSWRVSLVPALASVAILAVALGAYTTWRWSSHPLETNVAAPAGRPASAASAPVVNDVETPHAAAADLPPASPLEPPPGTPAVASAPAVIDAPAVTDVLPLAAATPAVSGDAALEPGPVGVPERSELASNRGVVLPGDPPAVEGRQNVAERSRVGNDPAPARLTSGASSVDDVVALVNSGTPEALVIEAVKQQGRTYRLTPADLLKLTNAGAGIAVITAMLAPGGNVAAAAPAGAASAGGTPYPPDLPGIAPSTKRRLAVAPFDYSTVVSWVQYWFNSNYNIGDGMRAMLTVEMADSPAITVIERERIDQFMKEQDFTASNRVRQGTGARIGQISGADVSLYGDIVIFGRDDTTRRKSAGAIAGRLFGGVVGGGVTGFSREEKAVVGINLRLVDTETGDVLETAEVRGESSRTSKDFSGVLGGAGAGVGAVAGGSSGMTSSNFQNTIIGEATANAVAKAAEFLKARASSIPAKPRSIEGRVALLGAGTATLAVGATDGVQRGDRFEILQINGVIRDPATREVIDVDAVKVGELVVDNVRDRIASGAYGGLPLSTTVLNAANRGYAARLMSR